MDIIKKLAILLLVTSLLCSSAVSATEISIGLHFEATAKKQVELRNPGGFSLMQGSEHIGDFLEPYLQIRWQEDQTIAVLNAADESVLYLYQKSDIPLEFMPKDSETITIGSAEYRGNARFLHTEKGMTVINHLDMEDYLKGVVASEMPHSWPIEALKAQAVCARNYALTNLNKFHKYGFNLDDTTQSQVYLGVKGEYPETNLAVEETKDMYLFYDNKLATTFFFSSSGGHTESSKYAWGGDLPYLTGVEDPFDTSREWTVPYTPDEIEEKLAGIGISVGDVTGLEVVERSPSGRIIDLNIIGTTGNYHAKLEKSRSLFNLRSNLFTITEKGNEQNSVSVVTAKGIEQRLISQPVLTATGLIPYEAPTPTEYIFNGTGFGHGVGMSQYGAKGMAEQGYTYDRILAHYFQGTVLKNTEE